MHLFYEPGLDLSSPRISGAEAHHGRRVLRIRPLDSIRVTDGKGTIITGKCDPFSDLEIRLTDWHVLRIPKPTMIHLGIGILHQQDRMEWLAEKATEIGVTSMSFLSMTRCERPKVNAERLNRIVISALKQSGQAWLPEVHGPMPLANWLSQSAAEDQRFVGHIPAAQYDRIIRQAKPGITSHILIGPEGDFTDDELALARGHGFLPVSLGDTVMRTETAALAAVHELNLVHSLRG